MLDLKPRRQAGVLSRNGRSQLERLARWQVTKGRYATTLPLHRASFFLSLLCRVTGHRAAGQDAQLGDRRAPSFCTHAVRKLGCCGSKCGTILLLVLREWNNEDVAGAVGVLWKWCGADGALIRQCGHEVAQTSLLRSGGMMKSGRGAVGFWERVWRVER